MPTTNLISGNEQKHIDDYPSSREANYVLGLLFLAYAFSFIDRQVLGVMVGPIKEDLALSDFQFSLLQGAAFALLYAFAGLPLARAGEPILPKLASL
jgi:sugar phosphate permease